jgi:hypothetical protein
MPYEFYQIPVTRPSEAAELRRLALVLALVLGPAVSAVNFFDQTAFDSASLDASHLLTLPSFSGIGSVEITEGNAAFRGTGVLVADNWVLTAAHNWDASAVTGLAFNWNGQSFAAQSGSWYQPSGWLTSPEVGLTQGWDIGLFQLAQPILGATPATLFSGNLQLGSELTFFGAGLIGTGSNLQANPDATIYAGTNTLDRILEINDPYGTTGLLAFDFDDGSNLHNSLGSSGVVDVDGNIQATLSGVTIVGESSGELSTVLEATSTFGDSGGPAFIDYGSGPELVGIFSWGVNPTDPANLYGSGLGDVTYLTDLSHQYDWIHSVIIPELSLSSLQLACIILLHIVFRRRVGSGCR